MSTLLQQTREDATAIFKAGVAAVSPESAVHRYSQLRNNILHFGEQSYNLSKFNSIYLVGAGKATAPMAKAMEQILGDRLTAGSITVKYGHGLELNNTEVVEAGHPVPDHQGELGVVNILEIAGAAKANDLVICLLSGGGSALLPKCVEGVTLADKQLTTSLLLGCGATIHEINSLRKHLSAIKGGQLVSAAAPATVVSLILSDVVGDNLDVIASGPTVPDSSTFADCLAIVEKYAISNQLPDAVITHLKKGAAGQTRETPKLNDPLFSKSSNFIIGSNIEALLAAEQEAKARGYKTLILSSVIEGETADVAKVHSGIAREVHMTGHPAKPPLCILSGGETTVTLKGSGKGGRNQEFCLCAAEDIAGERPVVILSGGTDGNDGPTDAAGALVDNTTCRRASQKSLDIAEFQRNNDAYQFFAGLGDLLITGPTMTNVMDVRIILIPAE